MKVTVDVRNDAQVRRALTELGTAATPALVASINRTTRDMGSRVSKQTSEYVNLSRREIAQYISLGKATRNKVQSLNTLKVRRVPIEQFRPRVEMRTTTLTSKSGRTYKRKLPTIHVKRLRSGASEYVAPAFPLTQRRTGLLRKNEKVRRRIGEARERLTGISYFSFPRDFTEDVLLPDVDKFVPERLRREIERALERAVRRTARS